MSSDASSTSGPRSLHDPWRTIHNPITGEVLTFLESGVEQCVFDLVIPSGRVPVVTHRHPGTENFHVLAGRLHLTVDGVPHDLEVGQQHGAGRISGIGCPYLQTVVSRIDAFDIVVRPPQPYGRQLVSHGVLLKIVAHYSRLSGKWIR